MKVNKYIGVTMMAAGVLAAASCTDFDDYNKEVADTTASATSTLWENIKQNSQLSDFAQLVQKAGFDDELSQTHYYTVWAPLNGTFDASAFQNLGNSSLLRQFVKNHIADYRHSATGALDERVLMLNEKSYDFAGSAAYTFGEVPVSQANLPSSNGLIHTLQGAVPFYPNLYEFITDSTLAIGKNIDSLRHYFQKYELTYLDEEASVPGPIVDGMQTYVDSVMVTENTLWSMMNVMMTNEDSTYTVLMPTNDAWLKTYNRIKSYYNYAPTTNAEAFQGGNISATPSTLTIDNAYWQDSLASSHLVRNMFFSNNDIYNQWIEGTPSAYGSDTIRSTIRNKFSNPRDILAQAKQTVELSNGKGYIVDSLAMYPWETYAPEREVLAASNNNIGRVATGSYTTHRVHVIGKDQENEDFSYIHVIPSGGYARPELDLFLPGVLSTTYSFYCVFAYPVDDPNVADSTLLPNRVIFTLNYCDEKGALKDYTFLDESEENISSFQERFNLTDNNTNRTTIRAFSNNPKLLKDTVYLGDFTFPVCYAGLGDEYRPNIKITSPFSVFNRNLMAAYTRDLRIAAIIMKPKELVAFEESNKQ